MTSSKSNRAPWIIGGLVGCLVLCLSVIPAASGAYSFFGTGLPKPTDASATPTARPTKSILDIPKDKATCEAQGGKWGKIGLNPHEACNLPTTDAGKVCADSSECDGTCAADLSRADQDRVIKSKAVIETKGKCTPWRITVGCIAPVTQGKVNAIMCID